jgi:curved DNA-binding protein CbpA
MLARMRDQLLLEPRWRNPEATPYELLGIDPGAPVDVIRRTYLHLVSYCHPDRYPDAPHLRAQAEFVTKRVNEAYRELGARHDALSAAGKRQRSSRIRRSHAGVRPLTRGYHVNEFLPKETGSAAAPVVVGVVGVVSILAALMLVGALMFLFD